MSEKLKYDVQYNDPVTGEQKKIDRGTILYTEQDQKMKELKKEAKHRCFLRRDNEKRLGGFVSMRSVPLKKKIKEFSTGMKRKLQILAALSHNARLLVLDEPTAGLDVVARDELLGLLREYAEDGERSIVISSHISSDLEGICDDVYMIENGKIVLHEDTDVLLNEYGLLKVTKDQFSRLDQTYLLRTKEESFGYSCLTNQRQFYQDNYPSVVIERGSIDEVITLMSKH